ncbi:TPA: GNAT family N-acetyltransferase [Vibrio cholerae]|uniref:GNAT family N-acetyltransferase n=1 Tax=Vibrio cholerae TaxID=666 RepID=UPI0004E45728|nr:GNAT family N-acetyltransferase [Vibrio cholerae]EGR2416995.1 GNAT family N-acetyltransferase [Vibrio cholerae]EGR2476149.1 GNAT family N-acetyltransferase [Vibrio cholerae]KFD82668.1 acetyltransferase family protein [Vibrio cholerae]MDV2311989.1 GNAT family N-acetyltransferase [Vibrio cholerae]CAB1262048.1 acetyltransferase (putative) [Vibrio cholerae]
MEIKEFSACNLESLRKLYLDSRRDSFTWLKTDSFRLEDFDRDSQGERIWLSEVLGNLAGFLSIWEHDSFVHHLYVATEYHGQGVGTMLLNGAKAKYGNLSLKCMVQNQKALNFYLSQGFEIVSQVDDELGGYYYMSFGAQT